MSPPWTIGLAPGRAREIDEIDVVAATLAEDGRPPERLEVTHWSARLLADELGISFASVARIWRKWNIQPWRVATFKFSTDPEFQAKVRDRACHETCVSRGRIKIDRCDHRAVGSGPLRERGRPVGS